jgi:peptidoglycan-N-acetylmuramic acid deacetylase
MKRKIFLAAAVILLVGSVAGLNYMWLDRNFSAPDHYFGGLPQPPARKPGPVESAYNRKEGWGFVKSRNGQTPEITAHQKNMVQKYQALFVGDVTKKQVVLTFDMGYEKEGATPRILETLDRYKVKAAFFTTAHWIRTNPDLARRVVAEGHIFGNHTYAHKSLPTLNDGQVKDEILKWEEVAKEHTGTAAVHKFMRPPMGEYSEKTLKITRELGYTTAFWSIAMKDWLPMGGPQEAVKGVVNYLHNGAVVLLHGNSMDVVEGLDGIIKGIKGKGYTIVPLDKIR